MFIRDFKRVNMPADESIIRAVDALAALNKGIGAGAIYRIVIHVNKASIARVTLALRMALSNTRIS
jgi:hypothetical protein